MAHSTTLTSPVTTTVMRSRRRIRPARLMAWMVVILALLFALFPVYWIVLTAFRPRGDIFSFPAELLPTGLTLDNINYVWFGSTTNEPIIAFLGTSFIVAGISTLCATTFGMMCAYAVGRFRIGGELFSMWILAQRFLPPIALIVPMYLLFRQFHLLDTYLGLILLYTTFNIPLTVWLILGYVESLPKELEEAAYIDGASHLQTFMRVVLPLIRPGLAVAAVFAFVFSWNEYIFAFQLAGNKVATITVYLPRLRSAIAELYGEISAASLLSVIPAIVFAGFMQRFLVRGLTMGGGKDL